MDNMINRTNAEIVQILANEPVESRQPPARAVYAHMRTNGGSWRYRMAEYEKIPRKMPRVFRQVSILNTSQSHCDFLYILYKKWILNICLLRIWDAPNYSAG
ncbi:hypothetical protein EhV18_00319 [Emiliania huxleyi virus 18]|nr:hypothetical protein EhV18_00319 [Emiliania huxleyi virus 18]